MPTDYKSKLSKINNSSQLTGKNTKKNNKIAKKKPSSKTKQVSECSISNNTIQNQTEAFKVVPLNDRGQLIIPKSIRNSLNIKGNTQIGLTLLSDGSILMQEVRITPIRQTLDWSKEKHQKDLITALGKVKNNEFGKKEDFDTLFNK